MIPIALPILPILALFIPEITSVTTKIEDCGGTYKGFQYTISSPNYPRSYPVNKKCVFNLVADYGNTGLSTTTTTGSDILKSNNVKCDQEFHLQFLDFDLGAEEDCAGDKLQVGDGHVFCGRVSGLRKFTGRNGTLKVTFQSDDNEAANKGFKILVTAMPCSVRVVPSSKTHSLKGITDAIKSRKNGIPNQTYQKSSSMEENYDNNDLKNGNFYPLDKPKNVTPAITTTTQSSKRKIPTIHHSLVTPAVSESETQTTSPSKLSSTAMSQNSPRITSYIFLPPQTSNANVTVSDQLTSPFGSKSFAVVTTPPAGLSPPQSNTISPFSHDNHQANKNSELLSTWDKSSTSVINIPSGSYGDTGLGVVDYKLNVANNFNGNLQSSQDWDTDGTQIITGKINNLYSDSELQSQNSIYDPRHGAFDPVTSNEGFNSKINLGYGASDYNPIANPIPFPNSHQRPGSITYNPLLYNTLNPYPNPGFNPNLNPVLNPGINPVGPGGECCRVQSARQFSLTSPGFPGNTPPVYSCRHTIVKASPDVCQLRLNFRFFNFGGEDLYCTNGHVEIDGRRYCGCRSNLRLLIPFQEFGTKEILVNYVGFPRSRFSGFVIDVLQEPCRNSEWPYSPPRSPYDSIYHPFYKRREGAQSTTGTFGSQNGPVNGHGFRGKRNAGYTYDRPSIPFPGGEVAPLTPNPGFGGGQDRIFGASCQNRVFFDWLIASKDSWFRNNGCIGGYPGGAGGGYLGTGYNSRRYLPAQKRVEENPIECREIGVAQGVIQSPSYPNSYPDNVRSCFRFKRIPNHCELEVYVQDFQLEPSAECVKDYLSFGRDKYCGESLKNTRTPFDLTASEPVEIYFTSDSHGTGRGFTINFSQRPCRTTAKF
ncbi:hypothetical protein QAD02_005216 [Eretmocerus hayati]|uniref:Uncharacterized protein n=1 Tax=Eretmocerus hayati TaxID=131215 RepID=A0ACC2NUH1_9HYME|nr:hypothetical protein QAD02_005216 [Eretmocerus hayati]